MNHYVVSDGVHSVQEKLLQGLDVRLGVQSFRVSPVPSDGGVEITTRDSSSGKEATERFDFVVLAVSPDIVARVFKPLQSALESIPTTTVETVAHTDSSLVSSSSPGKGSVSDQEPGSAQHISFLSDSDSTESTHQQPTSVLVTTNPLSDIEPSKIIQSASFTRVLRTPESRALVNELFRENEISQSVKGAEGWRNGDNGVFLAGGWCWDGMVLLEGCVVSAMRVASALGVEVPW